MTTVQHPEDVFRMMKEDGVPAEGVGAPTGRAGTAMAQRTAAQQRTPKATSPATDRTLTVLEVLSRGPEAMTLTAIAAAADIPIATCAAILYSLEARGYATRTVVGRSHFWSLTLGLYSLASQQVHKLNLASSTRQDLQALSSRVGLPAHVGVVSGNKLVYLAKEAGASFIQFDTYPGKVVPFNLTALGRAVAAHLPPERIDELLDGLEAGAGPNAAPPEREAFLAQLALIRQTGYAIEDQEEVEGVACIAAPFFDASGSVVAAVGVTSIADRMEGDFRAEVIDSVVAAGHALSRRLGAHVAP